MQRVIFKPTPFSGLVESVSFSVGGTCVQKAFPNKNEFLLDIIKEKDYDELYTQLISFSTANSNDAKKEMSKWLLQRTQDQKAVNLISSVL